MYKAAWTISSRESETFQLVAQSQLARAMKTTVSTSFTPVEPTALCPPSLPMASTSPVAPGLSFESVHNVVLNTFGPDCVIQSFPPPSVQGVQASGVWMLPDASDEEDALAAGEFAIDILLF
jgi:hypothetical protein